MPNTESILTRRIELVPQPGTFPEGVVQNQYTFSELYQQFLNENLPAQEKITKFQKKVTNKYSPSQAEYISRALIIATAAHQFNWNTEDRFRKEREPVTDFPIPYIYHPLEMADRLVDENLNWVAVSAILMHDVAEDVRLGEGLNTREEWFQVLRDEFLDTEKADFLVELIDGVTERKLMDKSTEDGRALRVQLQQSQMYKMMVAYLIRGRLKGRYQSNGDTGNPKKETELTEDLQEAVFDVVYNLNHLFESALFSPEHLQILILKITDIWHNFHSPKWIKPAKVLRGRLAAGIAEWMGWYSMRSDLIYQLAEITNTNSPYAPDLIPSRLLPGPHHKDLTGYEDTAYQILEILSDKLGMKTNTTLVFAGLPLVHTDYQLGAWDNTSLPVPEIVFQCPADQLTIFEDLLMKERPKWGINIYLPRKRPKEGFSSTRIIGLDNPKIQKLVRRLGRKRVDVIVRVGKDKSFTARFENGDIPYVIDIFKRNTKVTFAQVPEAKALFHNVLMKKELWTWHLASLIGFLYEPNMSVELGKNIYCILVGGNLFFVNGNQTFSELGKKLGFDLLKDKKIILDGIEYQDISAETMISAVPRHFRGKDFENRLIVIV